MTGTPARGLSTRPRASVCVLLLGLLPRPAHVVAASVQPAGDSVLSRMTRSPRPVIPPSGAQ